jgi:hypothetical protein
MHFRGILTVMIRWRRVVSIFIGLILLTVSLWFFFSPFLVRLVVLGTSCDGVSYYSFAVCPTGWHPRYNLWGCEVGLECPGHPELSF